MTFYGAMVIEGLIAMCWAGGAMILFSSGQAALDTNATLMVGQISRTFMGNVGGLLAVIGVIVLPITSGDTSFRALRLIIAEEFNISQKESRNRIGIAVVIFIPALIILYFAKTDPQGFNKLWRYFGFTNQFVAIFALAMATSYLYANKKAFLMTHIPGIFYTFIVFAFILAEKDIGLGIDYTISLIIAAVFAAIYAAGVIKIAKSREQIIPTIHLE